MNESNDNDKIIEEFVWLWKEYVLIPDEKLSQDALDLKERLINVVDGLRIDLMD